MTGLRFWVFVGVVLTIWGGMHVYVFWRVSSVPWVTRHVPRRWLPAAGAVLWSLYVLARMLQSAGWHSLASPLEYVGACWIGVLFLSLSALVVVEVITLGGAAFRSAAPVWRGWALAGALVLAVVGWVQAERAPVLRDHKVELAGLPATRDGLVLVQISDCHLGTLLGRRWLERLVEQVNGLQPDLIAVVGDLVDGNVGKLEPLKPVLQRLRAPLGVWAVTGNHEHYAGLEESLKLLQEVGFNVLRDRSSEAASGLILCGVDDLTARRQFGRDDDPVQKALVGRAQGATILLSHSPWKAEAAAQAGVGLMLCGHTHEGQVWPFRYLVALTYPLVGGRYEVNGMPVIVCRGTGTWGPRIRLWRPSELVRVTLRSGGVKARAGGTDR